MMQVCTLWRVIEATFYNYCIVFETSVNAEQCLLRPAQGVVFLLLKRIQLKVGSESLWFVGQTNAFEQ